MEQRVDILSHAQLLSFHVHENTKGQNRRGRQDDGDNDCHVHPARTAATAVTAASVRRATAGHIELAICRIEAFAAPVQRSWQDA